MVVEKKKSREGKIQNWKEASFIFYGEARKLQKADSSPHFLPSILPDNYVKTIHLAFFPSPFISFSAVMIQIVEKTKKATTVDQAPA